MEMRQKTKMYTRPEIELVPCTFPAIMGPSIHAKGSDWTDVDGGGLNFDPYTRPTGYEPSNAFRFKSVWDAKAKELQDGELVEVPLD